MIILRLQTHEIEFPIAEMTIIYHLMEIILHNSPSSLDRMNNSQSVFPLKDKNIIVRSR